MGTKLLERTITEPVNELLPLANDVILITGSFRGIGAAIGEKAAMNGAYVIFHGREKTQRAVKIIDGLAREGLPRDKFAVVTQDLGEPCGVEQMYEKAWDATGGKRITKLVNNVAIGMEDWLKKLSRDEKFRLIYRVNVDAQIEAIERGYEMGLLADNATIIYNTSNFARNWKPDLDLSAYSPGLSDFVSEYGQNVAAPKLEAEKKLRGNPVQSIIRQHNGKLVVLTAGIVLGTPAEAGLKRLKALEEAKASFGYTDLAHFAQYAYSVFIDPFIQNGEVITVPDLPL